MNIEKIKNLLNKEISLITAEQVKQLKSFAGWEITVFALVNLAILLNFFYYLNWNVAIYLETMYEKVNGLHYNAPTNFVALVDIMFKVFPVFILMKYLTIPTVIWTILKYGKSNNYNYILYNIDPFIDNDEELSIKMSENYTTFWLITC